MEWFIVPSFASYMNNGCHIAYDNVSSCMLLLIIQISFFEYDVLFLVKLISSKRRLGFLWYLILSVYLSYPLYNSNNIHLDDILELWQRIGPMGCPSDWRSFQASQSFNSLDPLLLAHLLASFGELLVKLALPVLLGSLVPKGLPKL